MKKSKHIYINALVVIIVTVSIPMPLFCSSESATVNLQAAMKEKLFQRNRYQNDYYSTDEFLTYYEKGDSVLEFHNTLQNQITLKSPAFFYNIDTIRKDIALNQSDSPAQKVKKIFNFVKNKRQHTLPLFENNELHNPPRFFSVYGSGLCDDAAINMARLATQFGFKARTHWLSGHVVADIKYDGDWHIYDPDALGIVYYKDKVANIEQMVLLAKNNRLKKYNDIYRTTENNQVTPVYPTFKPDNPSLNFFPGERKRFYNTFFMLPTDGHYLGSKTINKKEKFSLHYKDIMANFIREIPLNAKNVINDEIVLNDYFPFAGVFICVPDKKIRISTDDFPEIYTEFDIKIKGKNQQIYQLRLPDGNPPGGWLKPSVNRVDNLLNSYLNLTPGIKAVQSNPAKSIRIRNINALMAAHNNIKLLTIHYYCYDNAHFEREIINRFNIPGIDIKKKEPLINSSF